MDSTVPRDVAEVGLVELIERGGNADDDGVHVGDFGVVGGGVEAGFLRLLNGLGRGCGRCRSRRCSGC